jgi:hypothetical protein
MRLAHAREILGFLRSSPFLHHRPLFWGSIAPGRHPFVTTTLEMALIKRQSETSVIYDDQSPLLWDSYVGNWTHYSYPNLGFNNNTVTATPNPGASLSFSFSGIQIAYARSRYVVLMLCQK